MKTTTLMLAAVASLATLSACGGHNDDKTGNMVAKDADKAADAMETKADAASDMGNQPAADSMNAQADATRDAGKDADKAIDNADIKTDHPAATAQAIEKQSGLPTSADTAKKAAEGK